MVIKNIWFRCIKFGIYFVYRKIRNMRKFKISVLLSSGTTGWTTDYVLDDVQSFHTNYGYHYVVTSTRRYHFPIDRTIVEEIIGE